MLWSEASPETGLSLGCRNCGAALIGSYCAACGQRDRPLNPTLRQLAEEGLEETFDADGRLWRSLRFLFTRPGFLTRELFAGRRAAYVSPFRLYLLFSVVAFAAAAYAADRAIVTPQGNRVDLGMGYAVTFDPSEPGDREEMLAQAQRLVSLRTAWLPRAMFVVLPLLAFGVMVLTRRSRRHYPQHVQFTLHTQAVVFAALALQALIPAVPEGPVAQVWRIAWGAMLASSAVSLGVTVYTVIAFRRVYGGGWAINGLRVAAMALLLVVLWNAAGFAILFGGFARA